MEGQEEEIFSLQFDQIKQIIDEHFNRISTLLRYSKEKDANVLMLSKQLQTYRDGFETVLFKRIALEVISYRESSRKSLRDIEKRQLSVQEATKYISYIKLDFEDLLENIGVNYSEGVVKYNGKDIESIVEKVSIKDVPQIDEIELPSAQIKDIDSLSEYLQACESEISKILQNNTILDSLINDYAVAANVYEQGLYQVVLYPVIRMLVKIYKNLVSNTESLDINEDNATECYSNLLSGMINDLETVLECCNVTIDEYISDVYDAKKHRILKMINTENPDLNGQIVTKYTDCYTMDDKVIYLAKVDIYKFVKS